MSRIHSRRKGRARSHRPFPPVQPTWVTMERGEIEETAVKLSKSGLNGAQVGLALRDTYGVPSVRAVLGSRMTGFLASKGIKADLPEDLQALLKRVVHLQRHLETHPTDHANRRGLTLIESRIRRLSRYYRAKNRLPANWSYSSAAAVLQVE